MMTQHLYGGIGYLLFGFVALAAQDLVSAVDGTVKKVDSGTKTVVVKTADGAEHTFHFLGRTIVHGTEATAKGSKDAFHGLKEGSEVAGHYTAKGGGGTAEEGDHIGKEGRKVTEGAKDAVHGLKEGSEVAVHYTAKGGRETAEEVDHIGKDGLKVTEGTISHI